MILPALLLLLLIPELTRFFHPSAEMRSDGRDAVLSVPVQAPHRIRLPLPERRGRGRRGRRPSHASGSALLIVLWAITMMAVTVLGIIEFVHYNLDETVALEKDSRARQLAEAGVAIGMHPAVKRGDALLKQTVAPGETFEVHLGSEGGMLNINTILKNRQFDLLGDLFANWGLTIAEVDSVTHDFEDWAYPSVPGYAVAGKTGTAGTSGSAGTAQAARLFKSLDEMTLIPGMKLVAEKKPDWRNYFTVFSDGKLDVNEAPAELIEVVCRVSPATAKMLVNARLGPDGKPDTDDDVIFNDLEQVRQRLGLGKDAFNEIAGNLELQDSVLRVESTGKIGEHQRKIIAVTRRNVSPPVFLEWQEL